MIEVHEPISEADRFVLTQHESPRPLELEPATDANGIPRGRILASKIRARVSRFYFEDTVAPPTPDEVRELEGHSGFLGRKGAGSGWPRPTRGGATASGDQPAFVEAASVVRVETGLVVSVEPSALPFSHVCHGTFQSV